MIASSIHRRLIQTETLLVDDLDTDDENDGYPIMKILMLTTTVFQIVNSTPLPEQPGLVPILIRRFQRVITIPG